MDIIYYPSKATVDEAIQGNDLLLMIVSFDGNFLIISSVDDAYDFPVLTKPDNFREYGTDKYFRFTLNQNDVAWTFICPPGYKEINNQDDRIEQYHKDGVATISKAIKCIGYDCNIPEWRITSNIVE